jgi:hypothetical protein
VTKYEEEEEEEAEEEEEERGGGGGSGDDDIGQRYVEERREEKIKRNGSTVCFGITHDRYSYPPTDNSMPPEQVNSAPVLHKTSVCCRLET